MTPSRVAGLAPIATVGGVPIGADAVERKTRVAWLAWAADHPDPAEARGRAVALVSAVVDGSIGAARELAVARDQATADDRNNAEAAGKKRREALAAELGTGDEGDRNALSRHGGTVNELVGREIDNAVVHAMIQREYDRLAVEQSAAAAAAGDAAGKKLPDGSDREAVQEAGRAAVRKDLLVALRRRLAERYAAVEVKRDPAVERAVVESLLSDLAIARGGATRPAGR